MELYDALMTTRSMRRLTDDPPVTDEEIEHCLRAAAQAPSGGNVQPYHFVVITDPEARAAMADLYLRGWRRYRPAMVAALPPFPTAEAEGSFRRSVDLSEHLAEHLADTPSVLFCLASYDNTLTDDEVVRLDVATRRRLCGGAQAVLDLLIGDRRVVGQATHRAGCHQRFVELHRASDQS